MKATVDAYNGTVKLYQWDTEDPVLKTWMKAFPDTVEPRSEIATELMAHLRYPQDLFKVQRELLTRYHVTNAAGVLQRQRLLAGAGRPDDTVGATPQPPYYLTLQMPGQTGAGVLAHDDVHADRRRDNLERVHGGRRGRRARDYGKIRVLQLPTRRCRSTDPSRCRTRSTSDADVAERSACCRRGDSEVSTATC